MRNAIFINVIYIYTTASERTDFPGVKGTRKNKSISYALRIINNFKLMVLRAQTELGALLWICFTPKYMLLIFVRNFFLIFFFAEKFSKNFSPRFFSQKNRTFFPDKKISVKKNRIFCSRKKSSFSESALNWKRCFSVFTSFGFYFV